MAKASYNCDMNHAVDYGEWSSKYDEEIHIYWLAKFKAELARLRIDISALSQMLWDAAKKEKRSWYESELYYIRMSLS